MKTASKTIDGPWSTEQVASRVTDFADTAVAEIELGGVRSVKGGVDAGFGVSGAE